METMPGTALHKRQAQTYSMFLVFCAFVCISQAFLLIPPPNFGGQYRYYSYFTEEEQRLRELRQRAQSPRSLLR